MFEIVIALCKIINKKKKTRFLENMIILKKNWYEHCFGNVFPYFEL